MTSRRDIVIVGGGPAGTTTALALVHADPSLAPRILVLEKARYPREKPCAGAIGARGDALLRGLGVTVDVPAAVVDGISLRTGHGQAVASPGRIGRVVRRIEFDHALARAVSARGVEVRDGVAVESVNDDGEEVSVRTRAGTIAARVVVGCDGVGSTVRKSLGLAAGSLRAQVIEVDTDPMPGDGDRSLLHFDTSDTGLAGYAWDFPTVVDGRSLVCRGLYRLKVGDGLPDPFDLAAALAERLRRQGIDPAHGKNKRYAERGFEPATILARGSLMLAGEAAGIDPVTGEGIAQAIEFGVMAGRFLAGVLATRGAGKVVLDGWQDEVVGSRLGRDLRIRLRLMGLFYGRWRPEVESFLTESPDALFVGCQHFAAQSVDWAKLAEVSGRGVSRAVAARLATMLAG